MLPSCWCRANPVVGVRQGQEGNHEKPSNRDSAPFLKETQLKKRFSLAKSSLLSSPRSCPHALIPSCTSNPEYFPQNPKKLIRFYCDPSARKKRKHLLDLETSKIKKKKI